MPNETPTPRHEPTPNAQSQRLLEAAAVLLDASPAGTLSTTQLNKALFSFDLAHLRDFGETYTGATYIALKQGPVVAKYRKRLVGALQVSEIAHQG